MSKGERADGLTHLDTTGRPRMVDVSEKPDTLRVATAVGEIAMQPATLTAIKEGKTKKGDVLATAQLAAVMAAKRAWEMIPLCHPLLLTSVEVGFEIDEESSTVEITATVKTSGKTGVEMEALTAVSVGALTIYDMCKAIDRSMVIGNIRLIRKSGGRSGDLVLEGAG
ncbi:MAG: cyclic pyranopterin monophosphate synthase MoaC [Chloroflexi bacterium]|nr:cyclic pyranopterin monophosphate synthase MoaC [Chloroflexota bacterium]MCL5075896.1 cyclic pyranopterin monophosphate synthase MoaC [Chloroflexota bacterium]